MENPAIMVTDFGQLWHHVSLHTHTARAGNQVHSMYPFPRVLKFWLVLYLPIDIFCACMWFSMLLTCYYRASNVCVFSAVAAISLLNRSAKMYTTDWLIHSVFSFSVRELVSGMGVYSITQETWAEGMFQSVNVLCKNDFNATVFLYNIIINLCSIFWAC